MPEALAPVRVVRGDMTETLRGFAADRFHAIVTDPPYGLSSPLAGDEAAAVLAQWLMEGEYHRARGRKRGPAAGLEEVLGAGLKGFMGQKWDGFVPSPRQWAEVLRVLRPGGYALVFAGTRTAGWMAISLMLAGFEVLDQIDWLYGEGFPKGGDVSKRIDKAAGAEREALGVGAARCEYLERGEPCRHGERDERSQSGGTVHQPATAPATDEAARWEDWSTTLKPAHEPIIVARKPLRAKSVGANLLAWQTGALNIGACRIPTDENRARMNNARTQGSSYIVQRETAYIDPGGDGRWPANVVLSHSPECGADPAACVPGCAAAALDEQGGDRVSGSRAAGVRKGLGYMGADGDGGRAIEGSAGGPTRFFYCPKASRADRECGAEGAPETSQDVSGAPLPPRAKDETVNARSRNPHPTVKPTALMRWLVRLVCPPEWRGEAAGEVLDPFGGSGSTGVALALEGLRGVLVERDESYARIAEGRVARALLARETGEIPKPWRDRQPRPLDRKGCAPTCPVSELDQQSGESTSRRSAGRNGRDEAGHDDAGRSSGPSLRL